MTRDSLEYSTSSFHNGVYTARNRRTTKIYRGRRKQLEKPIVRNPWIHCEGFVKNEGGGIRNVGVVEKNLLNGEEERNKGLTSIRDWYKLQDANKKSCLNGGE